MNARDCSLSRVNLKRGEKKCFFCDYIMSNEAWTRCSSSLETDSRLLVTPTDDEEESLQETSSPFTNFRFRFILFPFIFTFTSLSQRLVDSSVDSLSIDFLVCRVKDNMKGWVFGWSTTGKGSRRDTISTSLWPLISREFTGTDSSSSPLSLINNEVITGFS